MNDENGDKKNYAIPTLKEDYELIKQKQIELTSKRNRIVSLSEIESELVKIGLNLIE